MSSGYPNIAKSRSYLVPIFQEKYRFCPVSAVFLLKKGAWSKVKGSESKSNLAHVTDTTPGI